MKKLFNLAALACALIILTSAQSFAQRTISGIINDATGESLIGANILEKGTSNGTITDIDGSYSLTVADGATLIISYTGFTAQEIVVGNQTSINVTLEAGELLNEVVVTGYGTQREKEVTSAVERVTAEDFNKGPINDAAQLLQGKVSGLQVYNRGGDPNGKSTIRLRGLSTVGSNSEPLVVVDGIIGASLDNVDPNDILEVNVLKDGSAAAIYGSRGSSGVILVTTKGGTKGETKFSYNGQVSSSQPVNGIPVMNAQEFIATGGTDLGSSTDWVDEITRSGFSHLHSLSADGGVDKTSFRVSANIRQVDGILKNTGFDQFNARVNLNTTVLNDKLKIGFNSSFTNRDSEFGFQEALRYAITYNPTAPIFGADAPFAFNADQFGGYFQTLGLFDSFNPVALVELAQNYGNKKEFNYGATGEYRISDNFSLTGRVAQQDITIDNTQYYPTTDYFRGGASSPLRKGLSTLYDQATSFNLYELYGTYIGSFGSSDLTVTAGYSFQQTNFTQESFTFGDFPDNSLDFTNSLESSQDLLNAGRIGAFSDASPDDKIIAFFGRANLTINDAIFLNASVRREGSTRFGEGNKWGLFPAFGIGADLNSLLGTSADLFKIRLGYGVTGSLPPNSGLSQAARTINSDPSGGFTTTLVRAANPDLRWEEKAETNLGVEYGTGKFGATLDIYNRDISDFIILRNVDAAVFGVNQRWENAGSLNTKGVELSVDYDVVDNGNFSWNTGLVASTYKTVLESYVVEKDVIANLGAPGQNATAVVLVEEGREIGTIWGPVFEGTADDGSTILADINGDGQLITGQDQALSEDGDFQVLGNGIPDLELGWSNQIEIGDWTVNAFFRGAFGHSLVNTFRAFYEPVIASQSSYNYVNTSLREPNLTSARFSSLYVEKADFFKLDNLTVGRTFDLPGSSIKSVGLSLNIRNAFVITSYTGSDPEPSLTDVGTASNGGTVNVANPNPLAPGLDRRTNYFSSRAFTLGVNLNF